MVGSCLAHEIEARTVRQATGFGFSETWRIFYEISQSGLLCQPISAYR